jgi:CRP-like cAMP-binding protein
MTQHPFQNFMVSFEPGARVFSEGEQGKTMYIVQSGAVRLLREVEGESQTLGVLEKGDFFGEMSILEGLPRTFAAEAAEAAQLIEINSTIFDKMIRSNIEIAIRMLRKLSIRLREAEMKITELQASGARVSKPSNKAQQASSRNIQAISSGVRLEVEGQSGAFPIGDFETLIGRYDPVTELKPDIDLTDLDLKRTVSRCHARIIHADGAYVVLEEVGALNGTAVNGTDLVAGERHPLADGDRLDIGSVAMFFHT